MDIDTLIDFCAAAGEMQGNGALEHIGRNHNAPLSVCAQDGVREVQRHTEWRPEETEFVRRNLGPMTYEEIGEALGRTGHAVKIRKTRERIPAPSKRPGYLTGHQVAKLFRVDIHSVMLWHERGIMQFEVLPGERGILNVHIRTVYRWAVQPRNWIYFIARRVRDAHLRRLVELAQERWGDEWWTVGQVTAYHGLTDGLVQRHIQKGLLPAVRWGNWWVRKSDAVNYEFHSGKNRYKAYCKKYSPRADAWILRARDELGMSYPQIAARMKGDWTHQQVRYRYQQLKEERDE